MNIDALLAFSRKHKASDLHLSAGQPPLLRVDGYIVRPELPILSHADVLAMLHAIMTPPQCERYDIDLECDFAFTAIASGAARSPLESAVESKAETHFGERFRVNAFHQLRGAAAVFRHVACTVPTLEALSCPSLFAALALKHSGLILVTGPTGSGKSTTLAALVDHINRHRSAHIITIEDPIECIHLPLQSLISQRETGCHTRSFPAALRAALREDPDVIVVGELRDPDSIRLALTAAETGHLVLATLHTMSAVKTIDRLVDAFPGDEKSVVRAMLSESVRAVISQVLLPRRTGGGRVAAYEIMLGTPAVRNLIREGKVAQMVSALQAGGGIGMQTQDQHLALLLRQQAITPEAARYVAQHPDAFPD